MNNRLHKKKQKKISRIKRQEQARFHKKLDQFLKKQKMTSLTQSKLPPNETDSESFFQVIKRSFMIGQPEKSAVKENNNDSENFQKTKKLSTQDKRMNHISDFKIKDPIEEESVSLSSSSDEIDIRIRELKDPNKIRKRIQERKEQDQISSDDPSMDPEYDDAISSNTKIKLMTLSRTYTKKNLLENPKINKNPVIKEISRHEKNSNTPEYLREDTDTDTETDEVDKHPINFQFESQVIKQKKVDPDRFKTNSMRVNKTPTQDKSFTHFVNLSSKGSSKKVKKSTSREYTLCVYYVDSLLLLYLQF